MVATSQCSTETIFNYSWKQVMEAFWNRYPNPSSSHVLTEDTVEREVRDGKLYTRRILSKTSHVPKWGERFYKNTPIKIIEDSMLDPEKKILITFTRNIGMKKIMKVDEIVEYSEHSDGRTILKRRAYINSQVFGFSRAIRALGVERFKSNCLKTAHGFNHVLRQMFPNGERLSYPMHSSVKNKWETQHTKVEHKQPQHLNIPPVNVDASRLQLLKQAIKCSYLFLKTHLNKIAQILSIKN